MQKIIALALLATIAFGYSAENIVNSVNSDPTSTWVAGHNEYFEGRSIEDIQYLMGTYLTPSNEPVEELLYSQEEINAADIPASFDPRQEWSNCESIKEVRDQSNCGSCWAFGAAEAMSDRICISSGQKLQTRISTEDILSCCGSCGNGCNGGWPSAAWAWFQKQGVVTGNLYEENQYCQPYAFPPCAHHVASPTYKSCDDLPHFRTPKCVRECNPQYKGDYKSDKHFGKSHYHVNRRVENIQTELLKNGPITATINVYEDFVNYKSGVYQHKTGRMLGGHAIKLLGWGEENGTPYWLLANSWNETWGDHGFFKVLRGVNECGIEGGLYAGLVDVASQDEIVA